MKRLMKVVTSVALVIMILLTLSVTAFAAGKVVKERLVVGDDHGLPFSDVPYESSDTSVVIIQDNGLRSYSAVAVGAGKAEVTGGVYRGVPQDSFHFTVHRTELVKDLIEMPTGARIALIFSILVLALILASCVYIFIEAPKCGMSRAWAIAPLLSCGLGFRAFIIVRSRRKAKANIRITTCPTCGGIHTENVTYCPDCGTKLQ